MNAVQSISRAIVALFLTAALFAMSLASGLHELTHSWEHGSESGREAHGMIDQSAGRTVTVTAHEPGDGAHSFPGEFCFFCIHGTSLVMTGAPDGLEAIVAFDTPLPRSGSDPIAHRSRSHSSPRAPPVRG